MFATLELPQCHCLPLPVPRAGGLFNKHKGKNDRKLCGSSAIVVHFTCGISDFSPRMVVLLLVKGLLHLVVWAFAEEFLT